MDYQSLTSYQFFEDILPLHTVEVIPNSNKYSSAIYDQYSKSFIFGIGKTISNQNDNSLALEGTILSITPIPSKKAIAVHTQEGTSKQPHLILINSNLEILKKVKGEEDPSKKMLQDRKIWLNNNEGNDSFIWISSQDQISFLNDKNLEENKIQYPSTDFDDAILISIEYCQKMRSTLLVRRSKKKKVISALVIKNSEEIEFKPDGFSVKDCTLSDSGNEIISISEDTSTKKLNLLAVDIKKLSKSASDSIIAKLNIGQPLGKQTKIKRLPNTNIFFIVGIKKIFVVNYDDDRKEFQMSFTINHDDIAILKDIGFYGDSLYLFMLKKIIKITFRGKIKTLNKPAKNMPGKLKVKMQKKEEEVDPAKKVSNNLVDSLKSKFS